MIRAGFDTFTFPPNDDLSTGLVPIGFNIDFFGQLFSDLYVNNNGNVTFNSPLFNFTPFPIVTNGIPMLAPFFADVDTLTDGLPVTYGMGMVAGHQAFGVNWVDVDYFSGSHPGQHNSFQLVLIDRSDVGAGDFDIEYNYGQITWETGDASGGTGGLGGSSARAGYTNGSSQSFEFAGSGVNGAFLDTGPAATSLVQNSFNSVNLGRYEFFARNGGIGGGGGPNGGDGIHIEQVNSDISSVNITGNTVSNNGANGINFAVVTNSALPDVNINGNTILSNLGEGVRLINPDLPALNNGIVLTMNNNTISTNGTAGSPSNGVDLQFDNGQTLVLNMAGNTISDNIDMGVRVAMSDTSSLTANIGNDAANANTFSGNGDAGMGITMSDDTVGASPS